MRNVFARENENINYLETWAVMETKMPELKSFCEKILHDINNNV
jgi:uncharacterized protein with HEPN domain